MIDSGMTASDLYRLERTVTGERLVPVQRIDDATHSSIALFRRLTEARAREVVGVRAEVEHLRQRLHERETELAQRQEIAIRAQSAVRRLLEKNRELVGEKRRLRDALIGKKPLPNVHYRIDVDRDGVVRESSVVTLDAFPHRDRRSEALAEARRLAERRGGQVRQVRLDTSARG